MRSFVDDQGVGWNAAVRHASGPDYKGRFTLVLSSAEAEGPAVELADVRWNSEAAAARTLETMSQVELRRRLRSALGRSTAQG